MMILCPNAHDEATDGAFTEPEQRYYQSNPHNAIRGYAGGFLKIAQPYCAFSVGDVQMVGEGALIIMDGQDLLGIDRGDGDEIQVSVDLYGEDGVLLAQIDRNEWISGSSQAWDIESGHRKLIIRQRRGIISLNLNAKNEPMTLRAKLWFNGSLVDLRPSGIYVRGDKLATPFRDIALVDMALRCDSATGRMEINPYTGTGFFVSNSDPIKRLTSATNKWQELHGRLG